jgi:hypothetical protein
MAVFGGGGSLKFYINKIDTQFKNGSDFKLLAYLRL